MQIALRNDQGFMANLCMNSTTLKRFSPLVPTRISITHHSSVERRRVERFIEQSFQSSYGATITGHYPALLSVHDDGDNILAALGFRYARNEKLFLECYFDDPIETVLSQTFHKPVSRDVITEIGNLASRGQGAYIFLFTALNAYLEQQGMEVNSFTATDNLHHYFSQLGLELAELAKVDRQRLINSGASWGDYFDENPRVLAGYVNPGWFRLRKRMQIVLETTNTDLQARIHHFDKSEVISCE